MGFFATDDLPAMGAVRAKNSSRGSCAAMSALCMAA
jgi:hypothetical protein